MRQFRYKTEFRWRLFLPLLAGVLLQTFGLVMLFGGGPDETGGALTPRDVLVASLPAAAGTLILVVGCAYHVRWLGRHPAWALLGAFNMLGLSLLLTLLNATDRDRAHGFEVKWPLVESDTGSIAHDDQGQTLRRPA